MKSSIKDLPVFLDNDLAISQGVEWGNMTFGAAKIRQTVDITPLLKGLPNDRCQCPHWGYVLKGQIRAKFSDQEEVYETGDLYFIPPGHTIIVEAGTEYIEISPTDELAKSQEVIQRNMQAMQ